MKNRKKMQSVLSMSLVLLLILSSCAVLVGAGRSQPENPIGKRTERLRPETASGSSSLWGQSGDNKGTDGSGDATDQEETQPPEQTEPTQPPETTPTTPTEATQPTEPEQTDPTEATDPTENTQDPTDSTDPDNTDPDNPDDGKDDNQGGDSDKDDQGGGSNTDNPGKGDDGGGKGVQHDAQAGQAVKDDEQLHQQRCAADDPDVEPGDLPQHRHVGVLHQCHHHRDDHSKKEGYQRQRDGHGKAGRQDAG